MTKHREQSGKRIVEVTLIEKGNNKRQEAYKTTHFKSNGPKKPNDKSTTELGGGK